MSQWTVILLAASLAGLTAIIKAIHLSALRRVRYDAIVNPGKRLMQWLDNPDDWQARHFAAAPFGGTLSTWLWSLGHYWGDAEPTPIAEMMQLASWGVLTYGMFAVAIEGVVQMFYAMAKRRRDLNAAENRGREKGRQEGLAAALNAMAARLDDKPDVDPMQVIAELRAELQNGQHP